MNKLGLPAIDLKTGNLEMRSIAVFGIVDLSYKKYSLWVDQMMKNVDLNKLILLEKVERSTQNRYFPVLGRSIEARPSPLIIDDL